MHIRRHKTTAFVSALAVLLPIASLATPADPQITGAIPYARPDRPGKLAIDNAAPSRPAPNRAGLLKSGLDALAAGDIAGARAIRDSKLTQGSLDGHVLSWAIAMYGGDKVPSADIAAAAQMLSGWPGMERLRRNSERALAREAPAPRAVVAAFGGSAPQTPEGVALLARAYVALGDAVSARRVLSPFWRSTKLEAKDEANIIREFGRLIPAADHRARMEQMLYHERVASAQRVAGLAGAKALADAWAASIRGEASAGKLLDVVPSAQRSAGYLFAKAKYLRKAKKFTEAAQIMLSAPRDAKNLVDPDAWWVERRVLSRELLDKGDAKLAYRVAAAHSAESPVNVADAEFHAGWYALRALNDAKTAAAHFARIATVGSGPISLSRAYYWLGRAAEAGGPGKAADYFARAAEYGTSFYGQLAAERIGRKSLDVRYPEPTAADRQTFASRETVRAIGRLEEAGYANYAGALYRDLAAQLTRPGELALLAVMAEKRGDHFTALRVGKIAAARGVDVGALSHPVGVIPASADISGAGKALAYAVARQESEFNVGAVSGAGARGLLQLLPGTAKELAKKAGMTYSPARLTTDAGYNATLGAAFLGQQLSRFQGSYVLTFAAYNAGPSRAADWVSRYGDPRGARIDAVVDWIERIPFTETRAYVQRVMENYEVYKMRLSGSYDIVGDLVQGR